MHIEQDFGELFPSVTQTAFLDFFEDASARLETVLLSEEERKSAKCHGKHFNSA